MTIREYEDRVRLTGFSPGHVLVKLIDEDGEIIAGGIQYEVPLDVIPISKRSFGASFKLRRRAFEPSDGDTEEVIREALASAFKVLD